jgi:hypothetical protein
MLIIEERSGTLGKKALLEALTKAGIPEGTIRIGHGPLRNAFAFLYS